MQLLKTLTYLTHLYCNEYTVKITEFKFYTVGPYSANTILD